MIYRPLSLLTKARNAIFLAGPLSNSSECDWREEIINIIKSAKFAGDIINPYNPVYSKNILDIQTQWECKGFQVSSAIIFWIPRTKENPALITNIELGEWLSNPKSFIGFPPDSLGNDYIAQRCKMINKPVYHSISDVAMAAMKFLTP